MTFNSYRYPRYHLTPPAPADQPWTPVGPSDPATADEAAEGEIDLTAVDLRDAQGAITRF